MGTFVQARTPVSSLLTDFLADHDLEEVLVYRRSLEIEAAQTAAVKRTDAQLEAIRASYERSARLAEEPSELELGFTRDDSFHRLIVEASGSRLLLDLYEGVMQTLNQAAERGLVFVGATRETMLADHGALLQAIEDRDVRNAAHSMALHADRDLGIHTDTLDFTPHTERAETLIEAGLEPQRFVGE